MLEDGRADGGGRPDGGDGGQEYVLGEGGEDLVWDPEHHAEGNGEAADRSREGPSGGEQRADRPDDQQADQDQVRAAGGVAGCYHAA